MALDKTTLDAYIQALYDDDGQLSSADYQLIINFILSNGEPATDPRDLFQIRRGDEEDLPTLAQGEPAFTLDGEDLFIGGLNGNVSLNLSQYVNVKTYGAKGDGVSDDTTAITNAVTQMAEGKTLYFPKGTYLISHQIVLPKIVHLFGSATIKASDTYDEVTFGGMITTDVDGGTNEGVVIDGLFFDGNGKDTFGVYLYGAGSHVVKNCHFSNSPTIAIGGASDVPNNIIENNIVEGIGDYDNACINVVGDGTIVSNNRVINGKSKGIVIGGTSSICIGNVIEYDETAEATSDGIYVQLDTYKATVTGNTIKNCAGNGIKLTSNTFECVVSNNTIIKGVGAGSGIYLQGATRCTVQGNTIENLDNKPGIYLNKHPLIGVFPEKDCVQNVVNGNNIKGVVLSDTSNPNYELNTGILMYDGVDESVISNNIIDNFTMGIQMSFAGEGEIDNNIIINCTKGFDSGVAKPHVKNNKINVTELAVNVRGQCSETRIDGNRLENSIGTLLTVAENLNNVTISNNTIKHTGALAVNVVFLNILNNLMFNSNNVIAPTTVTNSVYIGSPTYACIVGNITSGKALNVNTPDGNTVTANNVTLAPHYA